MRTIINLCSPLTLQLFCLAVAPLSVSRADPAVPGAWTLTGSMHDARQFHTATLLQDGRVLVAGGTNLQGSLHSAELYNPNTGEWSLTGSLHDGRISHTATLLPDGKVLVTGGLDYDFPQRDLKSAELYDPATGTWSQTGDMAMKRLWHTATLLPNGKVLVVGGSGRAQYDSEVYDPNSGTWSFTGALPRAIFSQTATLLQDGQVLIAGGKANRVTGFAELYDVANGLWKRIDNLPDARYDHTATLLPDGTVLVAGGFNYNNGNRFLRSVDLYDPLSTTWSRATPLRDARAAHTANILSSGKVLVAGGGVDIDIQTTSCEEYDPTNQTWDRTGPLNVARSLHTATLLPNGKVLAAGGENNTGFLGSAELFDPDATQ